MEPRITLITLGVADLERALRFYRDGLGWSLSSASTPDVAFFHTGGAVLALWGRADLVEDGNISDTGAIFGGIALAHNVRTRDEVDAILRLVVASGGTITRAAVETDWGGYNGYFADPDGHAWEVAWNPHWPLTLDG